LKNYEKALKIFETGLGKNNMDTAATYNNIAVLYGRIGKSSEALDYFKKTLKITETILGNNHSYIASIYNNIGINYESKKQYADALEYFDKALEILEKKNLNSHFPCKNKAQVLYKLANYEKAIEYYHKALTIFKRRKDYFSMFEIYPFLIYSSIKSDSDYAKIAEYFCHFLELFDIYFEKDTPFFRNIGPFFARENILNETVVNKIKEKIPYDVCKDNFDNFVKWIKALSAAVPGLVKTKTPG
jgi:tetratricopeptide (TPR) repeat protein